MTPLERAARALFLAGARPSTMADIDLKTACYADWEYTKREMPEVVEAYIADVRAVLTAIRDDPSDFMVGRGVHPPEYGYSVDETRAVMTWRAMIDAALEEGR